MCHLEYARLEVSIGVCLFTTRQCLDNNLIRIGGHRYVHCLEYYHVNTYFYRVTTVVRRTCDVFHFVKNEKKKALGKKWGPEHD